MELNLSPCMNRALICILRLICVLYKQQFVTVDVQSTTFYPFQDTVLLLTGGSRGYSTQAAIISPDWDFSQMGIGGLDKVQQQQHYSNLFFNKQKHLFISSLPQ